MHCFKYSFFRPLVKWSELFQYNAVGTAPEWPAVADVLFDFGKALKVDTVLVNWLAKVLKN